MSNPLLITISRQLGSGGAFIGYQLSKKLNILYLDRDIITQAAKALSVSESELERIDEKTNSILEKILLQFSVTYEYVPPQIYFPTDKDLFYVESKIIQHITTDTSAVVIGRCASYLLKNKPNHISIYLHTDMNFRINRVQELYKISYKEAEKLILQSDTEREKYCVKFTNEKWSNSNNYDLCIDTNKIGLTNCVDFIMNYIQFNNTNSIQ